MIEYAPIKIHKKNICSFSGRVKKMTFLSWWVLREWWMKHLSPMYPLGEETKKRNKGVQSVPLKNYFWYRKCTEGWGHSFLPPRLHLPDDLVNSHCSCFAPSPPLHPAGYCHLTINENIPSSGERVSTRGGSQVARLHLCQAGAGSCWWWPRSSHDDHIYDHGDDKKAGG